MLKLYKYIDDSISYWETWDKDRNTGVVHWGLIGEKGESKEVSSSLFRSFRKKIQSEIDDKLKEGYQQIPLDDHFTLLIEYVVEGIGTPADVEKRTRLQDKMDEMLGWTGLGHCDGGSIGSGTMEVYCYVVNYEKAKEIIVQALTGTEFGNYSRIYDEDQEEN